jgi:isopentenyl diphosphate isomerase/L-lactate dehydrogenase-like FMN-dependent dehydrogenase
MNAPHAQHAPAGQVPAGVHCARDYEALAGQRVPAPTFAYLAGGSGEGVTVAANRAAFDRRTICPRLLRDVTGGTTRVALAGQDWPHPILLAPVAFQVLVHPRAELDSARAAAATDTCMVASTLSSCTLEDIAAAAPGPKWFQLYLQPRREDTLDLVRRAEAAGYAALVVTLDAAIQLPSSAALRAGFHMPPDFVAANLRGYAAQDADIGIHGSRIFQGAMRAAPTWADLDWLRAQTRLPIWVKGVLHPDDARQLRDWGAAGLVVSNHGGRTLDRAPASLDVLPSVRDAVGDACPLLLDSGIRSGADVFQAIALGADAVLVGRLQVYALAVAGALGVAHMLRLLREELEVCMAMTGCASLADIRRAGCVPAVALE